MPIQPSDGLVDMKGLMALLSVKSRSSIYRYISENPAFPKPVKLSRHSGRVKFKISDVTRFIDAADASE